MYTAQGRRRYTNKNLLIRRFSSCNRGNGSDRQVLEEVTVVVVVDRSIKLLLLWSTEAVAQSMAVYGLAVIHHLSHNDGSSSSIRFLIIIIIIIIIIIMYLILRVLSNNLIRDAGFLFDRTIHEKVELVLHLYSTVQSVTAVA